MLNQQLEPLRPTFHERLSNTDKSVNLHFFLVLCDVVSFIRENVFLSTASHKSHSFPLVLFSRCIPLGLGLESPRAKEKWHLIVYLDLRWTLKYTYLIELNCCFFIAPLRALFP